jgi:hypothetical protein
MALPESGWDTVTCVQARMNGFNTRAIPEIEVDHLSPRNIAEGECPPPLSPAWRAGLCDGKPSAL